MRLNDDCTYMSDYSKSRAGAAYVTPAFEWMFSAGEACQHTLTDGETIRVAYRTNTEILDSRYVSFKDAVCNDQAGDSAGSNLPPALNVYPFTARAAQMPFLPWAIRVLNRTIAAWSKDPRSFF